MNFSCLGNELKSIHIDGEVAETVWFENSLRKMKTNTIHANTMTETVPYTEDFEFVWFEDGTVEQKEKLRMITNQAWDSGINQQVKQVLESNTNLLI